MSRDLTLKSTLRNFARDAVGTVGIDLAPSPPSPTTESLLEQALSSPPPKKPERSTESLIKDAAKRVSPETMALYERYKPTIRNRSVVLRMKI